ncbi:MAG: UvrD-helicase domain-containing protein [Deltaproteobacteria bacterium]|jgi:DNA helicase-2/ATP-dependent DNA helicase PcrA|nr:UvrD-helicase domain-containing protein [Deltaproteobacteria bacterium]
MFSTRPHRFFADLHIHSRFSRATSASISPQTLAASARLKGIDLLGTGDMTHPGWLKVLEEELSLRPDGFYSLKNEPDGTRFVPTGEVSCIYKDKDKTRKIHLVFVAPDLPAAGNFSRALSARGNVTSDGRPILGMSARDILEIALNSDPRILIIPAHIWTPWFSLFGSMSGYDVLEDCFQDLTPHIHVLETGLSSDPQMNRLLSALDKYQMVSSSDAHGVDKLGREATIIEGALDLSTLFQALKGGPELYGTVEFFPEEGKYHLDGHASCGPALTPAETQKYKGRCPVCGKPLTIGVLNRVMELADRSSPPPELLKPDWHILPLAELLGQVLGLGPATKGVQESYNHLMRIFKSEYQILMEADLEEIEKAGGELLRLGITRMRAGEVHTRGGYDGVYGVVEAITQEDREQFKGEGKLFEVVRVSRAKPKRTGSLNLLFPSNPKPHPIIPNPFLENPTTPLEQDFLKTLNTSQLEAVTFPGASLCVKAGPGSGKTRVLVSRALWFIRVMKINPQDILLTTFTRKAAQSIRERFDELSGETGAFTRIGTLHSVAYDIAESHAHTVNLAPEDFLEELSVKLSKGTTLSPPKFLQFISLLKNIESPLESEERLLNQNLLKYQDALKAANYLDYDDLINVAASILDKLEHPLYKVVLTDEGQDLSTLEYRFLMLLAKRAAFTVIGDPDQKIYGFRGAMASFEKACFQDRPDLKVVSLALNYRSTEVIVQASLPFRKGEGTSCQPANQSKGPLIYRATLDTPAAEAFFVAKRVKAHLGTMYLGGSGGKQVEAIQGLTLGDIAIIFRLRQQGEEILKTLLEEGFPCQISGEDDKNAQDGLDLKAEKISLLTMHAAKGLEFRLVFVTGLEEGLFPSTLFKDNPVMEYFDRDEEEERLFYVALTRAKEMLYLTRATRRRIFGKFLSGNPSPFWEKIPLELFKDFRTGRLTRIRSSSLF